MINGNQRFNCDVPYWLWLLVQMVVEERFAVVWRSGEPEIWKMKLERVFDNFVRGNLVSSPYRLLGLCGNVAWHLVMYFGGGREGPSG